MSREGREGRRIEPDPNQSATAKASSELVALQRECEQARVTLAQLQQDTVSAKHHLDSIPAAQLLEANEELVLAMLRAQTDAEIRRAKYHPSRARRGTVAGRSAAGG